MKLTKKLLPYLFLALLILPVTVLAAEQLQNPLTGNTSPITIEGLATNIINGILGFVGVLAFGMFLYGGFIWLTSAGNADKVKLGMNAMVWAVLGIAAIFLAYAILSTVLGFFQTGAAGGVQ
ncbi:MAG: hypothetical protein WCW02_01615 [Candidatus Buchananbacteria bacterium]